MSAAGHPNTPPCTQPNPSLIAISDGPQRLRQALADCDCRTARVSYRNSRQLMTATRDAGRSEARWSGVLLAMGLPDVQALETMRQLRRLRPQLPLWASFWTDEPYAQIIAICAGADGYLVENQPAGTLRADLDALLRGQRPLSIDIARRLMALSRDARFGLDLVTGLPDRSLGLDDAGLALLRRVAEGERSDSRAARTMRATLYRWLQSDAVRLRIPAALRHAAQSCSSRDRGRATALPARARGDARGCAGMHSGL